MNPGNIYDFSDSRSREELLKTLTTLKNSGKKIAFTNGCFDILHVGHLRYLNDTRAAADFLVIGLNTDASVRQNKGGSRPVVPQNERAEMLLGLKSVDMVVYFDEMTPKEIIEFIKPDVLVKGSQYAENEIVGAAFVQSYGGKLIRAKMIEGASTTNIIEKILKAYK